MLLGAFYGQDVVGKFGMAWIVLGAPLGLLQTSVSQVYIGESAAISNNNVGARIKLFKWFVSRLMLFGLPLFGMIAIFAPWIVTTMFGTAWDDTGTYIRLLCPLFLASTLSTPVFGSLDIAERQNIHLLREIIRMPLTIGGLILGGYLRLSVTHTLLIFSLGSAAFYLIGLLFAAQAVRHTGRTGRG
jgi:O-antigen/teichoic acid export membrane protein